MLIDAILRHAGAAPAPAPQPAAGPDLSWIAAAINDAKTKLLRQGARGDAVKWLQALLNANGASLVADGSFGPKTDAAVRAFQRQRGLLVDGIVGRQTWGVLAP